MTRINFIFALLLLTAAASPIAQPLTIISERTLGRKDYDLACPTNGTLPDGDSYFGVESVVPISAYYPTTQFSYSNTAIITPNDFGTIFNLVVPPSGVNKTCTLEFLLPSQDQIHTNYTFAGPGHFTFTGYANGVGATEQTTFHNQPPAGPSPPTPPNLLTPGNAYTINAGPCGIEAGAAGMVVSGLLASIDTTLVYQQSERGCPIGFFVTIT